MFLYFNKRRVIRLLYKKKIIINKLHTFNQSAIFLRKDCDSNYSKFKKNM